MVCHENYPVGHWQEIQIWNHSFFLTFFSHAHQNITFQSPWKLGRIRILSYRFPQQQHHSQICWIRVLVKIVALFTSERDCKYIIYEFEYLDPGTVTRRVFNGFLKKFIPATFRARATVRLQNNSRLPQFSRLTFAQDYFLTHLKNVLDCCLP